MNRSKHTVHTPDPQAMIPLTPAVFHILLALGKADLYGLLIMQEVETLTHYQMRLGPGTLYRSLQRMMFDGLIEERDDLTPVAPREERRRVYHLTSLGKEVARLEAQRLAHLVDAARARGFLSQKEDEA
jgi:DNA-binding PadR family transcriptional regulator